MNATRPRSARLLLILPIIVFGFWPRLAQAQSLGLSVDPTDSPLIIRGKLSGQTASFFGNIRLTASGLAATDLQLLAPDLQLDSDPSVIIDRSNISIPAGTNLNVGQPRDVRVTVTNIVRPGTYRPLPPQQSIRLIAFNQDNSATLDIPVEVRIDATPMVALSGASPNLQLVRCVFPVLDCLLAPWFGGREAVSSGTFALDNRTLARVEPVLPPTVLMHGEKTGTIVGGDALEVNVPQALAANAVSSVSIVAHPDKLRPDHYTGSILLNLQGTDDRLTISSDVSVRDGPVWPLVMVLVGIAFGRIARQMQSPEAVTQLKLMPRYYQLDEAANNVTDPDARRWVFEQLQAIKARIDTATDTEDVLTQAVNLLDARIELLASLDGLDAQLAALNLAALRTTVLPLLDQARKAIYDGDDAQAQQLRTNVQQQIAAAQRDASMGPSASDQQTAQVLASVGGWLARAGTKLAEAIAVPQREALDAGSRTLATILAFLAGADLNSADIRFWLFRPLLFVLLLVVLTLLGMHALYVNAGATFGANGAYDYLGLVLWGLSADIAQRTLQNLPVPTPK